MTDDERSRIRLKIAEFRAVSEAGDGVENRKARLELVANFLLTFPTSNGTHEAGRARAEAYLLALDDLPPWAIAGAIKRWHRGEWGQGYDYRWAPAAAELRAHSRDELRPIKETIARLEAVLGALSLERAMDPSPIEPEFKSESDRVVHIGMRRI